MDHGFVRIAAAVPQSKVADCGYNAAKIIETAARASEEGAQIIVFPELCITSYTCGDLFHQKTLLDAARAALDSILSGTKLMDIILVAGLPVCLDNQIFNCAVIMKNGMIFGTVPKTYVPGYNEFYEERWFAAGTCAISRTVKLCSQDVPFGTDIVFYDENDPAICFGVEICEDLWMPLPPSSYQAMAGAVILLNLSASNEIIGKYEYRSELIKQQSGRCTAAYAYASAGTGESTTDLVFAGHSMIAEYGSVLAESERFLRESTLICADVDVHRLISERYKNTSFMEPAGGWREPYAYAAAGINVSSATAAGEAGGNNNGHTILGRFRKIRIDIGGNKKLAIAASQADTPLAVKALPKKNTGIETGKLKRHINPHPFVPSDERTRDARCREIFSIQTAGLAKRIEHTGMKKALIAVSGGLDSTLALLVTARTFDILGLPRKNIIAFTMPGFGTTGHTYGNAVKLMEAVGATVREVDIKPACLQHFKDIGHDPEQYDTAYENVQARERCQILMDTANKEYGVVIGTGDLSELALGWCTYNGDHMSMYSVNCGIPKTLVKHLVRWAAGNMADDGIKGVLYSIIDTPISPELLPPDSDGGIRQKTEDIVGPYELHDFFLYHMVRYGAPPKKILFLACEAFSGIYDEDTIRKWLKVYYKRFFSQQFKRSCLPDGPKVGTISLSPRGDWRMPSDAEATEWLKEL